MTFICAAVDGFVWNVVQMRKMGLYWKSRRRAAIGSSGGCGGGVLAVGSSGRCGGGVLAVECKIHKIK